ncbi:hypothetical protein [Acinetobacter cumulans]|jgi:hypothetical protein|uniref:hypothetical protein n=1 Tax=Acinetobacter cumulans TaxID=2136182 RepID=UPI00148B577B|nr:hypothetical protein [Acinetobacter cumulans]
MHTMNDTENPKKFPFSESELLENIDEYRAHADEIAVLTQAEYHHSYCKRSTPFFQK